MATHLRSLKLPVVILAALVAAASVGLTARQPIVRAFV
jgi:hypothetical protein